MEAIMKKALVTYAKYLAYAVFVSITAIGKSPLEFTKHDLIMVANSAWASLLPIIIKAVNPKDPDFGITHQA
jgi:hypothetical protein